MATCMIPLVMMCSVLFLWILMSCQSNPKLYMALNISGGDYQSAGSNSSGGSPLFSSTGTVSSPGIPPLSKDGMAHERRKGPPVDIFLFTCLQQSDNGAVWEAGANFPGSAGLVSVVAKLVFSDEQFDRLIHENNIYNYLTCKPLIQLSIPTCYGVYHCCLGGQGMDIGLLLTSMVPGTTANWLSYTEFIATMCVHVALHTFFSWMLPDSPSIRDAVKALHAQGVTHGDIAGRNIIVSERKPTLIDFGKARITTDSKCQWNDLNAMDGL